MTEKTFHAVSREEVPVDLCAIMLDDEVLYVGQIRHSPTPPDGATVYLNPKDFKRICAWMRRQLH
jgi:hypothetical protein